MTIDDVYSIFDGCSFPVCADVAPAGTFLPYAVLHVTADNNTAADNVTYSVNVSGTVELYTLSKDFSAMAEIENALQAAKLPWQHDTSFIDGQRAFMEVYTFGAITGAVEPLPTPEPTPTPEPEPVPDDPEEDPEENGEG